LAAVVCVATAVSLQSANAQVAGAASLQSDYELYGFSMSARRPVAIASIAFDQASGLYLNGSAIGAINRDDHAALLGLIENVGYASRVTPLVSIDGGLGYSELFQRYGANGSAQFGDVYIGVATHGMSLHVYYSPNYLSPGARLVYEDWQGEISGPGQLRFGAHVGALEAAHSPYGHGGAQYDWRLTLSRSIKVVDVQLGLSGGGPSPDYYDLRPHARTALVAGASWAF
jgi:uncharacterized protein (TIGR02001 family)